MEWIGIMILMILAQENKVQLGKKKIDKGSRHGINFFGFKNQFALMLIEEIR